MASSLLMLIEDLGKVRCCFLEDVEDRRIKMSRHGPAVTLGYDLKFIQCMRVRFQEDAVRDSHLACIKTCPRNMNAGVRITKFSGGRQFQYHLGAHTLKILCPFPYLLFKKLIMAEHKVFKGLDPEKVLDPNDQFRLIDGLAGELIARMNSRILLFRKGAFRIFTGIRRETLLTGGTPADVQSS